MTKLHLHKGKWHRKDNTTREHDIEFANHLNQPILSDTPTPKPLLPLILILTGLLIAFSIILLQ